MLQLRLNTYALTSKFLKMIRVSSPVNVIFFHGFTLHDSTYPIVDIMLRESLIDFYPNSKEKDRFLQKLNKINTDDDFYQCYKEILKKPKLPPILSKQEQLFSQNFPDIENTFDNLGKCNFGNLITISLDYSNKGVDLQSIVESLKEYLGNRKTIVFSYSYGVILTMTFLDALRKDHISSYFNNIIECNCLNGSFLPYDEKFSIPPKIALDTAMLWRRSSLVGFARKIGVAENDIKLLKERVSSVADEILAGQKRTLVEINSLNNYYRSLLDNKEIMSKWYSMLLSTNDKIFPIENLVRLAKTYNLPTKVFNGEHYIEPVRMVEIICSVSKYEAI